MANWIEQADEAVADAFRDWNLYTTIIALAIAAVLAYPILYPSEPDTHPLLLAKQSLVGLVRNKNESASYRSPETPQGYPMKSGLNVKAPGAARWAAGKDGDLRDIWREVARGGSGGFDGKTIPKGIIMTVLGKEEVVEHEIEDLNKEMNIIGKHLKESGCQKIAIYLPNSMEYLLTIFACAFYGLTPILLPYNQPHAKVFENLTSTDAQGLICAAGNLPLDEATKACPNLRHITWVVEKTSRHVDWSGSPSGNVKVNVWHELVEASESSALATLPESQEGEKLGDLIVIWQSTDRSVKPEVVTFTQGNIVAAVGALTTVLPLRQRLGPHDLVVPANSFHFSFSLCWTLTALYQHASLAITSLAEPGVEFSLACRSVSPTVVIASVETMAQLHEKETRGINSGFAKLGMANSAATMSAGRMPTDTLFFKLLAPSTTSVGDNPGKLRLVLTAERMDGGTPTLTSAMLSDLRIFTRARICYALTAAKVAGAITQSHIFDYRIETGAGASHFGGVLSSVEVKLTGDDSKLGGYEPVGDITVEGPAVSGEFYNTGVRGKFRDDGCLKYD
ncbi:AMP-extracellular domain-containing protein [Polychaeton citri CBS 116435]|uniref:AMP-extracellular domain-containing protein n=1 Tax=Polychaeton citri CBS 116435 TaxID=1314669 RepID=A0A9P4QA41_9PEZI|nr:AMP-extracellular domain-containing protein [Polychaeton citri CBS 116435]